MQDPAPTEPAAARYTVAVRSLCEFTARRGDLSARFTAAPTAQQGMAGHGIVAGRRAAGYQRELALRGRFRNLIVRGRADGYDPAANRLEEIKTHRGDLERMPGNQRGLHWAQLKIYGALLCAERRLERLEVALVYFEVESQRETLLLDRLDACELRAHFETHCEAFLDWAAAEVEHRARRDGFLGSVVFPYAALRAGQRQMAEEVYRTARRGGALLVQAPTGIGKTMGSLFPALKAAARGLDKILYLVAKTSGRALALDALEALPAGAAPAPLRVLELVSKESACPHPGRPCEAVSCPLAAGFYDRLPAARRAALTHAVLRRRTVAEVAAQAGICPYYLTQELTRWCDVIVGDYNYFFDGSAILHALTMQNQWRIGLLVDEAHNLVARAQAMYSATLEPDALDAALAAAGTALRAPLARLQQVWRAVHDGRAEPYFAAEAVPPALVGQLQRVVAAIADAIAESAGEIAKPLLRLHFDALHFCRMADAFGAHALFDVTRVGGDARLCIRNVSPAPFLAPRFAACHAAVLFSATLEPAGFHRRLLGLPEASPWIDVASPFGAHQLEVRVERRISTRYHDRRRSLRPIAALIGRQYQWRPGNYLAFFSSFDYLQAVLEVFRAMFPRVTAWEQSRGMDGARRDAFVANFTPGAGGIGFAVLGGIFAEGIDLPGERLIGAFIATLGLPCVSEVNLQIERRMQMLFDAGYEYTYLYPGLQKVVQAAGRVIRTGSDRGTVFLIDDRYTHPNVRRLLPRWWRIRGDR
jgi:Rad3-related DNA helicase